MVNEDFNHQRKHGCFNRSNCTNSNNTVSTNRNYCTTSVGLQLIHSPATSKNTSRHSPSVIDGVETLKLPRSEKVSYIWKSGRNITFCQVWPMFENTNSHHKGGTGLAITSFSIASTSLYSAPLLMLDVDGMACMAWMVPTTRGTALAAAKRLRRSAVQWTSCNLLFTAPPTAKMGNFFLVEVVWIQQIKS